MRKRSFQAPWAPIAFLISSSITASDTVATLQEPGAYCTTGLKKSYVELGRAAFALLARRDQRHARTTDHEFVCRPLRKRSASRLMPSMVKVGWRGWMVGSRAAMLAQDEEPTP